MEDQPPSKRVATDGPIGAASISSSPSPMQEEIAVAPVGAAPMQEETAVAPISAPSTSSSPSPMQEETTVAVPSGNSDVGTSQSPGQTPNENRSGSKRGSVKEGVSPRAAKMSAILPQIWKDDLNSGQILVSLFNLFGEGILSFIPAPEMSLFL